MTNSRLPPAWIIGMTLLPFGLVAGFMITAFPFLLTKAGVTLDRVAGMSAVVMSPTFWGFLVTPIVDVGLTRRTWAVVMAALSGCCVAGALWQLSPSHLERTTILLLMGELAIVLYGSAVGGWQAGFLPDSMRGKVSGWGNAANLGGGALGSMLILELAEKLPLKALALVFASLCLLPVLLFSALPSPARPMLGASRVFTETWRKAWETARKRECLVGFALFLSPASCVAAINLFSGLGKDFHAGPQRVIWVTGVGCAIAAAIGSVLGGFVADRVSRRYLYLLGGLGAAGCALGMAYTQHTAAAFTYGVLAYNGAAGIAYAAFGALTLELVGTQNPAASTMLGLFTAAANGAIVYMTWADGLGYRYFGLGGLFGVDAGLSLAAAVPLLLLVRSSRAQQNDLANATIVAGVRS